MRVAVEGCCHGELDKIYAALTALEERDGEKIDLLVCCGDFQALRNEADLDCMSVPNKYKAMGTFWKYYTGEARPPVPTLFIGGNHEASNHLWELYHGGWVAPDIYFMGFSGVVRFGGARIGGLSGIFDKRDFKTGYHERPPYTGSDVKTIYHVREYEVFKLRQLREPLDAFLSHDWPRGIARYGDTASLLRRKGFLRQEVETNTLGSPAGEELLRGLRPTYWFSAHLHTKFAALVRHRDGDGPGAVTRFLSLDKCLPGRDFLQVFEIPTAPGAPMAFEYDPEWLAVLRAAHPYMPLSRKAPNLPSSGRPGALHTQVDVEKRWVEERLAERGTSVPDNFVANVPAYDPNVPRGQRQVPQGEVRSPQTEAFLQMLDLPYTPTTPLPGPPAQGPFRLPPRPIPPPTANAEEIELPDDEDDADPEPARDEGEIELPDVDEDEMI